jgi:hypothetical protein
MLKSAQGNLKTAALTPGENRRVQFKALGLWNCVFISAIIKWVFKRPERFLGPNGVGIGNPRPAAVLLADQHVFN